MSKHDVKVSLSVLLAVEWPLSDALSGSKTKQWQNFQVLHPHTFKYSRNEKESALVGKMLILNNHVQGNGIYSPVVKHLMRQVRGQFYLNHMPMNWE